MLFRCTKISRPYPCHSLSTTSIRDNFESKLTLTSLCPSVVGPYQRIKFKRVRQKTTSRPLRTIAPPTLVIKLMSPDRNLHTWFCVRLSRCCQCGLCSDFERKSAAVLPAVYVLTPWQLRRWDQVILDKSYVWHTVVSYARLVPSNAWRGGECPQQHAAPACHPPPSQHFMHIPLLPLSFLAFFLPLLSHLLLRTRSQVGSQESSGGRGHLSSPTVACSLLPLTSCPPCHHSTSKRHLELSPERAASYRVLCYGQT